MGACWSGLLPLVLPKPPIHACNQLNEITEGLQEVLGDQLVLKTLRQVSQKTESFFTVGGDGTEIYGWIPIPIIASTFPSFPFDLAPPTKDTLRDTRKRREERETKETGFQET